MDDILEIDLFSIFSLAELGMEKYFQVDLNAHWKLWYCLKEDSD